MARRCLTPEQYRDSVERCALDASPWTNACTAAQQLRQLAAKIAKSRTPGVLPLLDEVRGLMSAAEQIQARLAQLYPHIGSGARHCGALGPSGRTCDEAIDGHDGDHHDQHGTWPRYPNDTAED